MSPQPEMRIGDSEREAAVSSLGEHFAAGRLTKEEYDERSEQAWAARTASQLYPLFADLPRPQARRPEPEGSRDRGPGPRRHPGWWAGAWMAPVLMALIALVVLTHLPWFVVLIVGWIMFAKVSRHWARSRHDHRHWDRQTWVR
ncbi:MAG: DUF1707 domain-containing protein [Nocardioidaceae bacterium]|nr:DUF1707 domain-containing protein [Nocardioidaceae bacterium]NUS52016.1 DUF1707 domain-containing protein [Nocardioidaceae bacterium]